MSFANNMAINNSLTINTFSGLNSTGFNLSLVTFFLAICWVLCLSLFLIFIKVILFNRYLFLQVSRSL